jgi:hypothetical protein
LLFHEGIRVDAFRDPITLRQTVDEQQILGLPGMGRGLNVAESIRD